MTKRRKPQVVTRREDIDPTLTLGLRKKFAADMTRRLNEIRRLNLQYVAKEDVLGLSKPQELPTVLYDPNQPRDPAGTSTGGQFSAGPGVAFSSMEEGKGKAWIKANQERYDTDPEFRALADASAIYSQGSYVFLNESAHVATTGDVSDYFKAQGGAKENVDRVLSMPLGSSANAMADNKNFFTGQNVRESNIVTGYDAGKVLHRGVASSEPTTGAIYRGVHGRDYNAGDFRNPVPAKTVPIPEVGHTINIPGVISFTQDRSIAEGFATETIKGTSRKGLSGSKNDYTIIYKVKPGAKALPIHALSPYKQKEVLSSGIFKVTGVTKSRISAKGYEYDLFEVEMEQTGLFQVGSPVFQVLAKQKKVKWDAAKHPLAPGMYGPFLPQEFSSSPVLFQTLADRPPSFTFRRDAEKVEEYVAWLQKQMEQGILEVIPEGRGKGTEPWTNAYVRSAYAKGLAEGRRRLRRAGVKDLPSFDTVLGGMSAVFYRPFHARRLELLYTRLWTDLKGVTNAMSAQMSREMALGMGEGIGPYEMARRLNDRVEKVGITRARLIARTEMVETHNRASLAEYEAAEQVIGEDVLVQWWTALDERVRSSHRARHGVVKKREEWAPFLGEPNCRCSLLPWIESLEKP